MGQKRRREVSIGATRRTEVFEDLAHIDQSIRLKAAQTLLSDFVPGASPDEFYKILRRLIRGLCSGRKAARLGFSVALTELLFTLRGSQTSINSAIQNIPDVVDVLIDQTRVSSGADSQENRDHQIGRLFGAEAIIKSGILFQPNASLTDRDRLLDTILELAKKKSWLREQCGFVLYRSLENAGKVDQVYAQSVIDKMQSSGLARTSEGIAIWIVISQTFPSVTLPKGVWRDDTPLSKDEKSKLARILREASVSNLDNTNSDVNLSQKGSWSANVHFAWQVVMTELISPSSAVAMQKPSNRLSFRDFWHDCVEDSLFSDASSDERKYWGIVLFQQGLGMANLSDHITHLFSTKLVQCLKNQLLSEQRYLHRAVGKARKMIIDKARANPDIRIMIIKALFTKGIIDFDKISKTRTIEELLSELDEPLALQICEIYNALILRPGSEDQKRASQIRQIAGDQLLSALKSIQKGPERAKSDTKSSEKGIRRILSLLAGFAYFDYNESAQPEISTGTRVVFRARLSSCLTYLTVKGEGIPEFAAHVTSVISKRVDIPHDAKLLLQAENEVQQVLDQSIKTMQRIEKEVENSEHLNQGLLKSTILLISILFLQVHDGKLDAVGMLEELNESFSKKRMKGHSERDDQSSKALIEILLALAAKPSKLFRRLSQQVFESIAKDVDESALRSMLKILNTSENFEGQNELFDFNNEDDGQESGEQSDSDASNVSRSDIEMALQEDQILDESNSTVSSSADGEKAEGSDEELTAFNTKLAQALGTRPANEDLNAEDDDSPGEDMNDEEMEALDEHLVSVFRERKKLASKKTEKKDAKKTIVDFKCRVLELLEIFIKRQHGKPLATLLLPSLLTLLRTTSNSQVSQKASDLLRDYSRVCKGKELPRIERPDAMFQMLESVHQEAVISTSNAHANACSQASLLLARILASHERDHLRRIVRIYGDTYAASHEKTLFDRNFRVKMPIFIDFNNWAASFGRSPASS